MTYITANDEIEILQLSTRTRNALKSGKIFTVGDLLAFPIEQFSNIRNMGEKSVTEILSVVETLKEGKNEEYQLLDISGDVTSKIAEDPSERDLRVAEEMTAAYGKENSVWLHYIMAAEQEHADVKDNAYLYWLYKIPEVRNAAKAQILGLLSTKEECPLEEVFSACPIHFQNTAVAKEILTELEAETAVSLKEGVVSRIL